MIFHTSQNNDLFTLNTYNICQASIYLSYKKHRIRYHPEKIFTHVHELHMLA